MRWILVDVVLALLAVGLLVVVGLSLWGRVKRLRREVSRASELVAQATARLEQAQTGALDRAPAAAAGLRSQSSS